RGQEFLLVNLPLLDVDLAFARKHPGDAVLRGEVAGMLGQHVADFADRAVLVVGQGLDQNRHAAGAVTLVHHILVGDAGLFTGAATDRTLDVFARHVLGLGVGDDRPQPRVHVDVPAAAARSDGQLLDDAG